MSRRWTGGRKKIDARSDFGRWNHNLHYHRSVLQAVPSGCRRALDVGSGEGVLARRLQWLAGEVIGLDADPAMTATARAAGGRVDYREGDFLTAELEPVDFIACVAALHHMDVRAGLVRMRELLRPGGVLVVVGLARGTYPRDLARDALASAYTHLRGRHWESPAPTVWPPAHTYDQVRRIVAAELPGATFRRRLLWRYTVTWVAP